MDHADPSEERIESHDPNHDQPNPLAMWIAAGLFVLNGLLFIQFMDADRRGFGDAERGYKQYNEHLAGWVKPLGEFDQQTVRYTQFALTGVLLGALGATRLIPRESMLLYLIWPYSSFLASKIKQEFLLFPLAFIRQGKTVAEELLICGGILAFTTILGENNGVILVVFRLLLATARRVPIRRLLWFIVLGVVTCLALDFAFPVLARFSGTLNAYYYTRETVNPEYSFVESVGVFASTFHLGVTPQADWWFGIPMTALVGLVFLWDRKTRGFTQDDAKQGAAALLTFFLFTSITHAFQNTRYYFFTIRSVFPQLSKNIFLVLCFLSVLHTVLCILIYEFYYAGAPIL